MRSIRTRITALTLAAILISILSFGGIGVYFIMAQSRHTAAETLNLICENRKDSLNEYLNSIQQSVNMISRYAVDSLDIVELTQGGALGAAGEGVSELPGRSEEQRQALDAYFDQHLEVISLAFQSIANHTNGIASCYYRINPEITTTAKGFFFSKNGDYNFRQLELTDLASYGREDVGHVGWYFIPQTQSRPSWIAPYYSERLDAMVISYTVPVYKSGTFIGVIGMDIRFETLETLIRQFTNFETGFFVLTDERGKVWYHPQYEMGTELRDVLPQLISTVADMHRDSSLREVIRYDKDGKKWQMAFTTLSNHMKLSAVVEEAEINAPWHDLTSVFIVAGVLILLFFAIFSAVVMQHVTDPLKRLTAAAQRLAAGDYDAQVTCQSNDEVGVLTDTFCTMRDRLKDQFIQLSRSEKDLQAALIDAQQASRAKTSFLSNMSHEIRTPMNAIIGLDNIALRDPDLAPHTREQLEKIGASARHLLGLINDILDVSRIESGRVTLKEEEFSFRAFIDQISVMINGQCMDKGLRFECGIIGQSEDYYIGDDLKLKQVLINILGNAVKFTPAGGTVTFLVEQTASFQNHRSLRFTIRDTGIGMSREYIPKLFEAFSQEQEGTVNQYGSTGLGMAITKNIVTMMNGDIGVESEKGVGTTFTVTVTLKSSTHSAWKDLDWTMPAGLRALVVDDDAVACQHALLVAQAVGIEAEAVPGGAQALERCRVAMEQGKPYQLLLADWKMPEMDGVEFTRRLRAMDGGRSMVILLTGYNYESVQDAAMAAGVDAILSKPLFTDSLTQSVQGILSRREQDGAPSSQAEEGTDQTSGLAGRRVLVVEDMELNAEILMDLLEMEEICSERAENGKIALEMFSAQPQGYYDAILMDVRMPVMNGLEATQAIRSLDRPDARRIPIIAMTANAFDEDVQRSLQAGMNAHLSKPVEPEVLYDTLGRMLQ